MKSYLQATHDSKRSAGDPERKRRPPHGSLIGGRTGAVQQLQAAMDQAPKVLSQFQLDRSLSQRQEVVALSRRAEQLSRRRSPSQRRATGAPVQRTGDDAIFEMENQGLAMPPGLIAASPWAAFEAALLAAGINTAQDLARFRQLYFHGQEQLLPTFQVDRANWPNIADHTQSYIDQGEDEHGGVVLTYMASRLAQVNDTNDPIARQRIQMGLIPSNRDLFRYISLSRGNRLLGPAHYPPGIATQIDEFPFASTYEGGSQDVSVHDVPAGENAAHGGALGAFYVAQGLRDGYQFRVTVI